MADREGEGARTGELAENELARQLATLALADVGPSGPVEATAAAGWWNLLARLGLFPPLVVVHDLGLLLTRARQGTPRRIRRVPPAGAGPVLERYEALLGAVAGSEAVDELQAAPLPDETVAVILASLLGDVYLRWPGRPRVALAGALPLVSPAFERERAGLAREHDPAWAVTFLQRLVEHERSLLARLEQLEANALRLLGLFPLEAGGAGGSLAELYQLVSTAGLADVVDFSLQLLPSLLETKRRPSAQRFSIDGYASVERRGNLDALLPSELAHDDEVFGLKALSDDLLYYGHERRPDAARRLHYILVDASASMRGAREVFARGLALALAKTFTLRGGDVWVRFFDSRLSERLDVGRAPRRELPRFLTFKSERGRNYARVFGDLAAEVARLRRESAREIALTFISHAECHIPLPIVEALVRDTTLYGIFVLPSKPIDLEYLPRLHRHQVVTAESLARGAEKRRRALEIVEDAALDR
ncbi:MAG TPA: hypothetical protein VG319_15245 [Polyangia bacterium]|jgi:hypothetical protein|nr:hypothetical protein [Polyangia bacterium]